MSIKHMICDWDETLAHTLPTIKNAYDFVYASLNMPGKTPEEIKKITSGKPKSEVFSYMIFGPEFEQGKTILKTKSGNKEVSTDEALKIAEDARTNFYKYIDENHLKDIFLIEGAKDFLDYCKSQNINLYILSSKSPQYLEEEAKALGIRDYFSAIYGSPVLTGNMSKDELKKLEKPNIGAFQELFKNNTPPANECCIIGDGAADQKMANNIGCRRILINTKLEDGIATIKDAVKKLKEINL